MVSLDTTRIAAQLNALAETNGWPMRCDAALAFERGELRELCNLWRAIAANGVPKRSAFDLRALRPFVRNILILERVATPSARRYRFRLFGSKLALLFGEHQGRFLDEMVSPALLPSWLAFYDAVLKGGWPLRIVQVYRLPNEDYLRGEILAAPLADETGEVRIILAATYVGLHDSVSSPFD